MKKFMIKYFLLGINLLVGMIMTLGCVSKAIQPAKSNLDQTSNNDYTQVNLVANRAEFKAEIIDPQLQNAWGLANKLAGPGRLVEYELDGNIVRTWTDKGLMNAAWSFAVAPGEGFGKLDKNI